MRIRIKHIVIRLFNYGRFAKEGGAYLTELFGKSVGEAQIAHSDILQEMAFAEQLSLLNINEMRIPDVDELKQCIDQGYLIICNVNSRVLRDEQGYSGHFVLLYSYDADGFILHNPGLPAEPAKHVLFHSFERAWAFPNNRVKNYIAIRLKADD